MGTPSEMACTMKIRKMAVLVAVAGVGAGCAAESLTGPAADLVGAWEWVESEGGIAGGTRTPESEGIERIVTFRSDGNVRVMENGALTAETTWEVAIALAGTSHAGRPIIRYGAPALGFEEQAYVFQGADTLVLDDGCCDGFVSSYVRLSP